MWICIIIPLKLGIDLWNNWNIVFYSFFKKRTMIWNSCFVVYKIDYTWTKINMSSSSWLNLLIRISLVTWLINTIEMEMFSHSRAGTSILHWCLVSLAMVIACTMWLWHWNCIMTNVIILEWGEILLLKRHLFQSTKTRIIVSLKTLHSL